MRQLVKEKIFPSRLTPLLAYGLIVLSAMAAIAFFYIQWERGDSEIMGSTIRTLTPPKSANSTIKDSGLEAYFYQDLKYRYSFHYFREYEVAVENEKKIKLVDKDGDSNTLLSVIGPLEAESEELILDFLGETGGDCRVDEEFYGKKTMICRENTLISFSFMNPPFVYRWEFPGIQEAEDADQVVLRTFEMQGIE